MAIERCPQLGIAHCFGDRRRERRRPVFATARRDAEGLEHASDLDAADRQEALGVLEVGLDAGERLAVPSCARVHVRTRVTQG